MADAKQDMWQEKWEKSAGKPGFHTGDVQPSLLKHLPQFFESEEQMKGKTALIPLCGKTKDLIYLSDKNFHTVGVEFVEDAINQFAEEEGFKWKEATPDIGSFRVFQVDSKSSDLKILKGDFFKFADEYEGRFDFAFDRASFVAIEPSRRAEYADVMKRTCDSILLVVFTYDQSKMMGPPYSVTEEDVNVMFGDVFNIELLEVVDKTKVMFTGKLEKFDEYSYKLTRKH